MFTVLIAEKEHIDAIRQENKLFFEPFLENKELAFCYWNPNGQNLHDSVPGLMDAVSRRKEWRAVIISNGKGEIIKKQNPFDVVDKSAIISVTEPVIQPESSEELAMWESDWNRYYETMLSEKEKAYKAAMEFPLQKLATWLCFRPEDYILNEVQEKQNDVLDWALEKLSKEDLKLGTRLEYMERNHSKQVLRIKENIRREFVGERYLNIAYPAEVNCISLRTAENGFFDPDTFWNTKDENEYSAFADRNMYFDKMRFLVFDLLPKTHRNFRNDYIRFLATMLIFSSNSVPGGVVKARHLYSLETETDDTPLCTLVTSYNKKLEATSEIIEGEIEKIRSEIPGEFSDKTVESMFCTLKEIPVSVEENCDFDKLFPGKEYGLFFDSPENEFHKWNGDFNNSEKELAHYVKQKVSSIRRTVNRQQVINEFTDVDVSRLTPYQMEDIIEYTDNAEDIMLESVPGNFGELSEYNDRLKEESEKVRKVINRRMTQKTTLILTAFILGLYLACFLPFLLKNVRSIVTLSSTLVLSGVMVFILAAILFVALLFMRRSVKNAVSSYNNVMHGIVGEIQATMKEFPKYLSAFYTVRRGHAVQNCAKKNLDEYTKSLRIRKKHLEDIRKRRAFLEEEYGDYIGDYTFCDEAMSRPYEYDFDQRTEYPYPAPFLAGDCRQIEFMSSGNFVSVPSSYVTKISVRMEGIYDN